MRLRTTEAGRYLGISPRTLEAWRIRGGGPPYHTLGRAVVYDTRELDAFLAERMRTSTSDSGHS